MRILFFWISLFLILAVFGQEFAQWRGPFRDGIFPDKGLLKKWPVAGPKLELQIAGIGKGYSEPVVGIFTEPTGKVIPKDNGFL
jgi:hypothetical protein